jgi:enterochelin esterase family protein
VPLIDRRYRTQAEAAHRGIIGRSSGGIGALWLAMNHPAVFGAVVSHAGDGAFRLTLPPIILPFCRIARRYGGPEAMLKKWRSLGKGPRSGELFDPMTVLASGAAYSPDPACPLGFALAFDWRTGELDEAVFSRWLRFDPIEICQEEPYRRALMSMRLIYLDAGIRDEYFLDFAARRLAERLRQVGIAVQHEEFEDGHRSTSYRYDRSLPLLSQALR